MKKGILKALGALIGKEISEEIEKEMQEELEEFKKILGKNRFLENIPNLAIETYELSITLAGKTVTGDFKTKIEHDKVLGVFLTHRIPTGGIDANRNSMISIQVDRKYVFARGQFHYVLLEKTDSLTIYDVTWRTDIDINTSDVSIEYVDGSTVVTPYTLQVYFICRKKQGK